MKLFLTSSTCIIQLAHQGEVILLVKDNFHYLLDQTASQAHSGRPYSVYNSCDIYLIFL